MGCGCTGLGLSRMSEKMRRTTGRKRRTTGKKRERARATRASSPSLATALRRANDTLFRLVKSAYFSAIPLDRIYDAAENEGLVIDEEEKQCILCGREGRATWPLTFGGKRIQSRLWITWYKMETGRYEVVAGVT
jgi:hypothetical protein